MKKLTPMFLATLIMTAPVQADDLDQAAKDVCGCLAEPYAALEKALQAMKTEKGNDLSRLMSSKGELTQMLSATEACMEALRKKYPGINADQSLQKQVLDKTRQFCPNPLETVDLSAPAK
ncbi:hypothetical protein L4174_018330 [Photobacterium sp. CCB-ST2H9]|uniref:hypothetical protein n=1 Tax=unclassified Photobacterium TaxID=2628852 RepID=UPI002005F97C|nr:hypothetical protein [Photobacterium sp. CCB-ST2H9]UTM60019.1 hypothetical protein L4174_018330 [Photobacterium sp. CCB-ST2H9]